MEGERGVLGVLVNELKLLSSDRGNINVRSQKLNKLNKKQVTSLINILLFLSIVYKKAAGQCFRLRILLPYINDTVLLLRIFLRFQMLLKMKTS